MGPAARERHAAANVKGRGARLLDHERAAGGMGLPMLYAWMGFLKPDADPIPQSVQQLTSDFLGQPLIKIHFAGALRDESGKRAGMMIVFEHDSREAAESFVMGSPYLQADLYEDHRLYEYMNQVG